MTRSILWTDRALKSFDRLDSTTRSRISARIEALAETGEGDVKRLVGIHPPEYRLRVGDWRVRFELDSRPAALVVLDVAHRRDAYR